MLFELRRALFELIYPENKRRLAMKHKSYPVIVSLLILLSITITSTYSVRAQSNVVVVTTTIQAAVDAAQPGDTVRVPPGMYHENVFVTKDNITIEASQGAIL